MVKRTCLIVLSAFVVFAAQGEGITARSVLDTMNAYRRVSGLAPYFMDARLVAAAGDRMKHMEDLGYWAHVAPDGTRPFVWLEKRGFEYSMAGENLAEGFETVEVIVDSWMQSPGHRENIVSSKYTNVGIAIIDGRVGKRSIGKSVVVLFARELVHPVSKSELAGASSEKKSADTWVVRKKRD